MTRLSRDCRAAPNKISDITVRTIKKSHLKRTLYSVRTREGRDGYLILAFTSMLLIVFGLTQNAPEEIFTGFLRIIPSSNILITDYISLGGTGAAFANAGLLMLLSVVLLLAQRAPFRGITVVGVFLMGSFGLFGKNIYNVWPIMFGTWLYARLKREPFREHIYTALFATSLGPIVTEFAFVLHLPERIGAPLGLLVGVCVGLVTPPLAAHLKNVHKGFSLYNVGFTAGIIGTVFVSLLKSYGYQTGFNLIWSEGNDALFGGFMVLLFSFFVLTGICLGPHPFAGLRAIFHETGQSLEDFVALSGFGAALLNMGLNGFAATGYVLIVGGPLNGPTIGGILTIAGFGACGKHVRNTIPVLLGVVLGSLTKVWNINDPAVLLAALFGTSLAPIAGHYGWAWGVVAGFLNSSVALSSGVMHGGMNLYNTGFSAGIVAAFLVPLMETLPKRVKRSVPEPNEPQTPDRQ
ncbi:MAG: DUF1576 domain-containing protein [Clostridiales bacterium]|nr:DUF1576 domain-containing protein [Clostridiales bacterium]